MAIKKRIRVVYSSSIGEPYQGIKLNNRKKKDLKKK
tara:strand:- start:259 stop:366 length:108 start_codon:yes stop_codon:yes gene_type:complete